ncbi:MAG TPA: DNA polymerase III subunit gamma/tau, partial [Rhabdochlamydiaceae bacterium]
IYIIDEVHMLSTGAFNALLKTLEEPPSHVKFFFATTEPHKVLPTIISRCQRFDLQRIAPDVMRAKLAWIAKDLGSEIEEGALNLLIKASEGSLRDAESLLDQLLCSVSGPATEEMAAALLGLMPHASFFALDAAISQENLPYAFSLAEQLFSSGKDPVHFLEGLVDHYRCHLLTHIAPAALEPYQKKDYAASPYTRDHCLYILDFLLKTIEALSKSPFKQTALEMVLLHLLRSKSRLTIDILVDRLEALEKSGPSVLTKPVPEEKKVEADPPPAPEPVIVAAIEPSKEEFIPSDPLPFQKALRESIETPAPPLQNKPQERKIAQHKLDTLVRFAAIELEGTIKG